MLKKVRKKEKTKPMLFWKSNLFSPFFVQQ